MCQKSGCKKLQYSSEKTLEATLACFYLGQSQSKELQDITLWGFLSSCVRSHVLDWYTAVGVIAEWNLVVIIYSISSHLASLWKGSTRSRIKTIAPVTLQDILFTAYPQFELEKLRKCESYADLAYEIFRPFVDCTELRNVTSWTYKKVSTLNTTQWVLQVYRSTSMLPGKLLNFKWSKQPNKAISYCSD